MSRPAPTSTAPGGPAAGRSAAAQDGLVAVDKPSGWTSHDVVARLRRVLGTRRVGHAGTLDPMATGVLVVGVGRGTRLLGHLALTDKEYEATVRLGAATVTDDAEGAVLRAPGATADDLEGLQAAVSRLTGAIRQRPSSVSAVKVDGRRAHDRVRAGEDVVLPEREVTVARFDLGAPVAATMPDGTAVVDLDAHVTCSSGTYVRALARDLGDALGVGGHLTSLRRTRVGPFGSSSARTLAEVERDPSLVPLAVAVDRCFPRVDVDADSAARVRHGARLTWPGPVPGGGPVGVFAPDGALLSLAECRDGLMSHLVVFA